MPDLVGGAEAVALARVRVEVVGAVVGGTVALGVGAGSARGTEDELLPIMGVELVLATPNDTPHCNAL